MTAPTHNDLHLARQLLLSARDTLTQALFSPQAVGACVFSARDFLEQAAAALHVSAEPVQQPQSDLVRRLREWALEHYREPTEIVLNEAADRIEALEALLRQHVCNTRAELSVGECVDAEKCNCSCGLLLTENSALEAAASPSREAELVKRLDEVMHQTKRDLQSAHAEICKLQNADPAKYEWPSWTPQANTLRWFDEIRKEFGIDTPAKDERREADIAAFAEWNKAP